MLNEKRDNDEEVCVRVVQAKNMYGKLHTYWTCRDMPMYLKMRIIKCYIWPVLLCGAETWLYRNMRIIKYYIWPMLLCGAETWLL